MSLAEEMLATMSASDDNSTYLADEEPHIVINESRQAIVPNELKTIAVTGDKDIETVTFDCVRYWDGHDLSTFSIYLNYVLPDLTPGTYIPEKITTTDGEEFYHFDWKIKNNITVKSGKISFAVTAIKTKQNEAGEIVVDKQWGSLPNGDCSIALGLDISNVPSEEESSDVLAQMSAILEQMQSNIEDLAKEAAYSALGTALIFRRAITNDDVTLNNIKQPGAYTSSGSLTVTDYPPGLTNTSAQIYVIGQAGNSPKMMLLYSLNSMKWYHRLFTSAKWYDWQQVTDGMVSETTLTSTLSTALLFRRSITNDDVTLNNIKQPGAYTSGSGLDVTDFPPEVGSTSTQIYVIGQDGNSPKMMFLFSTTTLNWYYRLFTSAKWHEWHRLDESKDPLGLNVCSFNIGLYNYGESGYEGTDLTEKINAHREFLANNFDVLGLQENRTYMDLANTVSADEQLLAYPFKYNYRGNFYLTISSKYPMYNKSTGYFTEVLSNQRGWMRCDIYPNGRKITLFNSHPEWKPEATETRKAQFEEIISILENEERVIMFGDWNVADVSEFDVFKDAGYTLMNGGYLPFKRTYNYDQNYTDTADTTQDRFFDNIIVKGDIKGFRKVWNVFDELLSDHLPISADITVG